MKVIDTYVAMYTIGYVVVAWFKANRLSGGRARDKMHRGRIWWVRLKLRDVYGAQSGMLVVVMTCCAAVHDSKRGFAPVAIQSTCTYYETM